MRKSVILSLIGIFFLSLISPNQGVFAGAKSEIFEGKTASAPAIQIVVQVVQPSSNVEVAVVKATSVSSSVHECVNSNLIAGDVVQGTANVNLNQPANCFDLELAKSTVQSQKLFVQALPQVTSQVFVLAQPTQISSYNVSPAPISSPQLPILPLTFYFLVVSFAMFGRRFGFKKLSNLKKLKISFTIHQLQVLRC